MSDVNVEELALRHLSQVSDVTSKFIDIMLEIIDTAVTNSYEKKELRKLLEGMRPGENGSTHRYYHCNTFSAEKLKQKLESEGIPFKYVPDKRKENKTKAWPTGGFFVPNEYYNKFRECVFDVLAMQCNLTFVPISELHNKAKQSHESLSSIEGVTTEELRAMKEISKRFQQDFLFAATEIPAQEEDASKQNQAPRYNIYCLESDKKRMERAFLEIAASKYLHESIVLNNFNHEQKSRVVNDILKSVDENKEFYVKSGTNNEMAIKITKDNFTVYKDNAPVYISKNNLAQEDPQRFREELLYYMDNAISAPVMLSVEEWESEKRDELCESKFQKDYSFKSVNKEEMNALCDSLYAVNDRISLNSILHASPQNLEEIVSDISPTNKDNILNVLNKAKEEIDTKDIIYDSYEFNEFETPDLFSFASSYQRDDFSENSYRDEQNIE